MNEAVFAANAATTKRECKVQSKIIYCANGTEMKGLSSEYSTAAGSNHGLSSWDELWAYTSEGSRRLWEELRRSRRGETVLGLLPPMPGSPTSQRYSRNFTTRP